MGRVRTKWAALVAAREDGLPNTGVVWAFPALLSLVVTALTALNLNGSSTSILRSLFHDSADPDLLFGHGQPVRSDEWLVQSSWIVSQVAQGFPRHNTVFPGGMDATVMNDLPTWDWSGLFRPHTWGFLLLGLDHGMAVRWWLPAALMMAAAYFFVVTVMPDRPLVAAALSIATVLQPQVQWWWLPILPNPVAFAFVAMAAAVWGLRCRTRWGRVLPAVAAGYLGVDMAMGIYVPFMIPAVLAAAAFVVGLGLQELRTRGIGGVVRGLLPLALAGLGAVAVFAIWLATRRQAIEATLGTVYPGRRVTSTGSVGEPDLVSLLSAPFQHALQLSRPDQSMGINQSEASSVLLVSLYLVPPLLWVVWAQWRRRREPDWTVLGVLTVQALVLAFLYVPGWDRVAALLGLDRAVPQRMRLIFVILAVVAIVLLLERLSRLEVPVPWSLAALTGAGVAASGAWVWGRLRDAGSTVVPSVAPVLVLALLVIGIVALARRRALGGVVLLLASALVVGAGVNPLNRGVFDLRHDTVAGREVLALHASDPEARWVGVGSSLTMATLVEAGVPAYSGVQTYPAQPMWKQIDPSGEVPDAWNRLAHIYWAAGRGDPDPHQGPTDTPDQIRLTFDSCATFAQRYVTYVLADGRPIRQRCLEQVRRVRQGRVSERIYRVILDPRA